jgi:hydroxymethylpyrimidine pyrophosphatase-like HAD family hydrolase
MRYFCLACDYDGTIAQDGAVLPSTLEALKRLKSSGRKLILATGRELGEDKSFYFRGAERKTELACAEYEYFHSDGGRNRR